MASELIPGSSKHNAPDDVGSAGETPASSDRPRAECSADGDAVAFIMRLAQTLHAYGTPAHRMEDVIVTCARELGLEAQAFALPTSVFISFGPIHDQQTFCLRVEPGEVNLERLAHLDEVWNRVVAREWSPRQGITRINEIVATRARFGVPLMLTCSSLVCASAARFFGGGWREIVAALMIGLVVGALGESFGRRRDTRRVFEFAAGFLAAFFAIVSTRALGDMSTLTVMLGSLIVLIPGLTLTVAINELATRNLVAGTARLMAAFMIFAALGFGVALGRQVGLQFVASPDAPTIALPAWTMMPSLLVASLCLGVLFRARPVDLPIIVVAGVLAFLGGRFGSAMLGPELGVCIGAIAVGVASNLFARITNRPAAIPMIPGIILLVPGGVGFMSFTALLEDDVVAGIETAFSMFLIAAGLVAGLLLANVAVPARKAL